MIVLPHWLRKLSSSARLFLFRARRGTPSLRGTALSLATALIVAGFLAVATERSRADEFQLDSPMYSDPKLAAPETTYTFAPQLKSLWIEALRRPEADLRRQAADAIVAAHRLGMPGLDEAIGDLTKLLESPDQHPLVVLTVARALAALDARTAAKVLEHPVYVTLQDLKRIFRARYCDFFSVAPADD